MNNKTSAREIVLNGVLIALVFVATYFIQIRLPFAANGGLIHMGNIALFTIAVLLGARRGAMAGAFGMALFDIVSAWTAWAPGTFVVRGVMGFIIGYIFEKGLPQKINRVVLLTVAIVISSAWMVAGYYVFEALLYGDWYAPFKSITGNLTQIVIGWSVTVPLTATLRRTPMFKQVYANE